MCGGSTRSPALRCLNIEAKTVNHCQQKQAACASTRPPERQIGHHRPIDCGPAASHKAMAAMDAHTVTILQGSGFLCPNLPNAECQRANRSLNGVQLSAFRTSVRIVARKVIYGNRKQY